jgi:LacI family transcriptional regulator, galactose operon repressor
MPSIKHVAILAGVSTATVSHVLNKTGYAGPEVRRRVFKAVRDLNYHPNSLARSLKTRRTNTVGIIITDITNPFYPAVVRGAEDTLAQAGYTLVIGNSDGDVTKELAYYRTFRGRRVDGLILITQATPYPASYLSRHDFEETPVVFINRDYQNVPADVVLADNLEGSRQGVSHLVERGHRRIGIIAGPRDHVMAVQRLRGFELALQDHGLRLDANLVREGNFDIPSGYAHAKELLQLAERPTALFVCNVPMTTGALKAIFESGISFPDKLALASFDDQEWLKVIRPSITAVAQPGYTLGSTGAEMLLARITGNNTSSPCRKVLQTDLMVRESTRWRLD